jgi:hypothetical protein
VKTTDRLRPRIVAVGAVCFLVVVALVLGRVAVREAKAGPLSRCGWRQGCANGNYDEGPPMDTVGGSWYWVRSPEEEKRVVMGLFNRYCIRCHDVNGRGMWDIPDVPDFTNPQWQAFHSDNRLVHSILEGRGSVMPPWRGTLSLDEAWAMARYIRTFIPGTMASRPDFEQGKKNGTKK